MRNFKNGFGAGLCLLAFGLARPVMAQGLPPLEFGFANGATVTLYGQVNVGVLRYDDGVETDSYGLIDNDNSDTRFGLQYNQDFGPWEFENVNEFSYAPYSTSNVNILNPNEGDYGFDNDNIRKLDFTLENERYGKFWIGQGSMATDGALEVDVSGTTVIAESAVAESASAQIIRVRGSDLTFDESLSGIEIGDAFDNFDGDRRVRIRYDTPSFANVTFAAAFGRNLLSDESDVRDADLFDASLTYENTFSDIVEFEAAVGYNWSEGEGDAGDTSSWGGSASGIHTPTGINLTFAAGAQDDDGDTSSFWYAKLGLLREFVALGDTAMAIDYYSGDDFALDDAADIDSTTSESVGLAVVQTIERINTELWLTYRTYDFAANSAQFEDSSALFGGARFEF